MNLREAIFRVVDFETTGVDPRNDRLCEVGWCDVSFRDGLWTIHERHEQFLSPGISIPSTARAVHHISDQMVAGAPAPLDFLPTILSHEPGVYFVAHNAEFDQAFASAALGVDFPTQWLCTYRLARHLIPDAPSYKNQVLRYELGFDDIPGDAHRAGHDACVTAHILVYLLGKSIKEDSTPEDVIAFADDPVYLAGTVGFGKHFDKTWQQLPADYLGWMRRQGSDDWDKDQWHTITTILGAR